MAKALMLTFSNKVIAPSKFGTSQIYGPQKKLRQFNCGDVTEAVDEPDQEKAKASTPSLSLRLGKQYLPFSLV